MDTSSIPRHSRRGFIQKVNPANLATVLSDSWARLQEEIIDFSVPEAGESELSKGDEAKYIALLSQLAREILADHEQKPDAGKMGWIDCRPAASQELAHPGTGNLNPADFVFPEARDKRRFRSTAASRLQVQTVILPDGRRQEKFDNGSTLYKDELGRVVEVYSSFGESLFFRYTHTGELSSFIRTSESGEIHSTGEKNKKQVTVRDAQGRVKAIGEYMSVDSLGRFYLHAYDRQYFCLDLVAGIHCERRRILTSENQVNYVTCAFAIDGFKMATVYSRVLNSGHSQVNYRFFGRDGSLIEFVSDDEFKDLKPSKSMPPCSKQVHRGWRRSRQAHTAWESVREYRCRVT